MLYGPLIALRDESRLDPRSAPLPAPVPPRHTAFLHVEFCWFHVHVIQAFTFETEEEPEKKKKKEPEMLWSNLLVYVLDA